LKAAAAGGNLTSVRKPPTGPTLLTLALLLCLATVVLVARPPDTPAAIKQTQGWSKWWWTSERVEDPLYRTPDPAPHRGVATWEVDEGSRFEVLFRLDLVRDVFAAFDAPATGRIQLDTRSLDTLSGHLEFDLASLHSDERWFEQGAGDAFSSVDQALRPMPVEVSAAHLGTAPRYVGSKARGDLVVQLPHTAGTSRIDVVMTRTADDRLHITTLDPIGCSLPPGFDGLDGLAAGWGVPVVPREIAIQLSLDLVAVAD
jgi:hypothetical protein